MKLIQPMLDMLPNCVTDLEYARTRALLLENTNIMACNDYDCGRTNLIACKLELKDPGVLPVSQPLHIHPIGQLEIIDKEVDNLVSAGILPKTSLPRCISNVVLVR